jgi:hypothetical protein
MNNNEKRTREEGNQREEAKKGRRPCRVSQTGEVKIMRAPVPIPSEEQTLNPMEFEARNQDRDVVNSWAREQLGVGDAEIMWTARRRQLLTHEKL